MHEHPRTGLRFFRGLLFALAFAACFYAGIALLLGLVWLLTGRWA